MLNALDIMNWCINSKKIIKINRIEEYLLDELEENFQYFTSLECLSNEFFISLLSASLRGTPLYLIE